MADSFVSRSPRGVCSSASWWWSIELRGGERLLSLLPTGSHSLAEVRLLRVGETYGAWRLEALNGNTAEFRIDGRVQHIPNVRARTITLNHDTGRWRSMGDQGELPAVLRQINGRWQRE